MGKTEKGYEEYMNEVREAIKGKYGSVYSFCQSKEAIKMFAPTTLKNVQAIVSAGSNTKSFPILEKLYFYFFKIKLEQKIKIIRTSIITEKTKKK